MGGDLAAPYVSSSPLSSRIVPDIHSTRRSKVCVNSRLMAVIEKCYGCRMYVDGKWEIVRN
jgi:hypothetical protein